MNRIRTFVGTLAGVVAVSVGLAVVIESKVSSSNHEATAMNTQSDEGLHTNDVIHQIWDSGLYPFGDAVYTPIYWLDDSTLLLMADKNPKPATLEDASNRIPWLYLWRLGEKPHPIGEDPQEATRFYRAARGKVCFLQKKIDPATGQASDVLMKGPPGAEREASPWKRLTVEGDGVPSNGVGFIEGIDCDQFSDPAMAGRIYQTDAYRRYLVDRTSYPPGLPPAADEYPVLMKSDGSDRKTLPISPEEFGGIHSRTFEKVLWSLEGAIGISRKARGGQMVDGFEKWKDTNCLALWRIDPESAATDRRCIPFGPWSGQAIDAQHGATALVDLLPTAKGIFFSSTNYTDSSNPKRAGASGLYRLEDGTVRRILVGYLQDPSVSPSGCKVAFVYGSNWATRQIGAPGSWTIAAIDLCSAATRRTEH